MQAGNKGNTVIWRYGNDIEIDITETGFATGWGSIPGGRRDFLPPVQTGSGAHPASCMYEYNAYRFITGDKAAEA